MPRILIISGSPKPQGRTTDILDEMIRIFHGEGIETELIRIGDQAVRGCLDCGGCAGSGKCVYEDGQVNEAAMKFETADGLVVGSPVCFGSPNGAVLSFLSRLFRISRFDKSMKAGAAVITGDGAGIIPAQEAIHSFFAAGGMKIACTDLWNGEMDEAEAYRDLACRMSQKVRELAAAKERGEEAETESDYYTDYSDIDFDELAKRPVTTFLLKDEDSRFPNPRYASSGGLIGIGGKLTVERLTAAYSNGIFAWNEEGLPMTWWCPRERFILIPSEVHISKNIASFMRKHTMTLEFNRDFEGTVSRCREQRENSGEETWIDEKVEKAYRDMHKAGRTFSAEAFADGELAGGAYGLQIGRCLFLESLFTRITNGSKMALILMAQYMQEHQLLMMDAQEPATHFSRVGFRTASYEEYMALIRQGLKDPE